MSTLAKVLDKAARARALGYADEPFYRGEASGRLPQNYESAFFSRDPEYAGGFAKRGGQGAPREFRLQLDKTFRDYEPVTASTYARILDALGPENAKLKAEMVDAIAPGRSPEWFAGFARHRPDTPIAESGAHVRQMLDVGTNNSAGQVFRRAGYDALDFGRDVEKLTGDGIRLADAAFDPARAKSRDITAGVAGLAAGAGAVGAFSSEAEAGKLPMDQASRLARAKEMGTDVNQVLYRGSTKAADEFTPSSGGEAGAGVYVTKDPSQASEYARHSYGGTYPEGANVTPLYARGGLKEIDRDEWLNLRGKYMDELRKANGGEWNSKFVKQAEQRIADDITAEGYGGLYFRNPTGKPSMMYDQGVIFDPKNIRSVNAAFDPAKADSSNLMASYLAPAVVGGGVVTTAFDSARAAPTPTTRPLAPLPSGRLPERDMRLATMRQMYGAQSPEDRGAFARHEAWKENVGEPEARGAFVEAMKPLSVTAAELVLGSTPAEGGGRPSRIGTQAEMESDAAADTQRRADDPAMTDMLRRLFSSRR